MKEIIKKQNSYIFIIILSFISKINYTDNIYYLGVKYITTFRAIDIMYSIIFTFLFFKVFIDNYYFYVLNRNNIIVRIGRKNYNIYILKKILLNSVLLFIINIISDFIMIGTTNFMYILINIILTTLLVSILPKKKEYDYELVVIMIISILTKLLVYNLIV